MAIVYHVINKVNGKGYVGQTRGSLQSRINSHHKNKKNSSLLTLAIVKYGLDSFKWDVIHESHDYQEIDLVEATMIEELGTLAPRGYNKSAGVFKLTDTQLKFIEGRRVDNRTYEYRGAAYTLLQLHEKFCECGLEFQTIWSRINISGWTVEDALKLPKQHRLYSYRGQSMGLSSLTALMHESLSVRILQTRLAQGWGVELAVDTPKGTRFTNKEVFYEYRGKSYTYRQLYAHPDTAEMHISTFYRRLTKGWDVERAMKTQAEVNIRR